jgi:hypothetical protein
MPIRLIAWICCFSAFGVALLRADELSVHHADAFLRKVALVVVHGADGFAQPEPATRRTPFTEVEVNSWFAYQGREVLPYGVTDAQVRIVGNGRVRGTATVDLEAIAAQRAKGGLLDPWSYLGGRVPVAVAGVLHAQDGVGRFDLEEAAVSGVPIPPAVLQDVISYYSRTADEPGGIRLDEPFALPSGIRRIEVGQGQAVVVQ